MYFTVPVGTVCRVGVSAGNHSGRRALPTLPRQVRDREPDARRFGFAMAGVGGRRKKLG